MGRGQFLPVLMRELNNLSERNDQRLTNVTDPAYVASFDGDVDPRISRSPDDEGGDPGVVISSFGERRVSRQQEAVWPGSRALRPGFLHPLSPYRCNHRGQRSLSWGRR